MQIKLIPFGATKPRAIAIALTAWLTAPAPTACTSAVLFSRSTAASAPLDRENFALRDFTLVIMKENSFSLRTFKADDTLLMAWAKDGEQAEKLLKTAREAYRFFEDWMGPYPWETLTIIELPFPMGGMEYQSLVMITDTYAE